MIQGELLTPWVGTGATGDPWHREVVIDYGIHTEDTTGQPTANLVPAPNLVACYFKCADATFTTIDADAKYHVLWSEEVVEGCALNGSSDKTD